MLHIELSGVAGIYNYNLSAILKSTTHGGLSNLYHVSPIALCLLHFEFWSKNTFLAHLSQLVKLYNQP